MSAIPIAHHPLTTTPVLRLIGGRSIVTGRYLFPCPADAEFESVALPERGTLWSYTVQRFAPKSPPYRGLPPFEPFAVGYVELPGALIVESRLTEVRLDALRIGMPMELTTVLLPTAPDGEGLQTFAFRPVPGGHDG